MFRARRVRRLLRRHRGLLRALVVAFALQISGLGHAVADAICCSGEEHESPDCADGDDCPPGCPDCHCNHGASLVITDALGTAYAFAAPIDFAPAAGVRASPEFSCGVYRPPRA
jgi:hypothetical protein